MICLCCGKSIGENASPEEMRAGWHISCMKKFFGTSRMPDIDVSDEVLVQIAEENTNRGFTVPGVQKKLSLHLTAEHTPRLTLVNYPTGYILKPQTEEYEALPEAEYLVMQMAKAAGIPTVPFGLIRMDAQDGRYAYITKRIDRILPNRRQKQTQKLAMEDFCQLDGRLTEHKYQGSYERCAKLIQRYSSRPGLDLTELFLRVVFSYAVGNSDMHLKNFSLIETAPGSGVYVLSPAYDMLPVNVILPADLDQFALTMHGKNRNLRRKDFLLFAENMGLPMKSAENLMGRVASKKDVFIAMCRASFLPEPMKERLEALIEQRIAVLLPQKP